MSKERKHHKVVTIHHEGREEAKFENLLFLCDLGAFARYIPTLGCGSAALGFSWLIRPRKLRESG
jgi:hypothetical protein